MQEIGLIAFVSMVCFISFILYKEIRYMPVPYEVNQKIDLFTPLLGHYYIDFSERKYLVESKKYIFDRNGIPFHTENGKNYYNQVLISQFALGAYDYYLNTKDMIAKNIFLKCADWLYNNLRKKGNFFYWVFDCYLDYPGALYKLPGTWFSAMAQGEGASVLLRAFSETKNEEYLQAAKKAITPILYDIAEGGISVVKGNNHIFPQEYPTNPPSDVLNGAIFAYFGVYDYYRVTGDPDVRRFHEIIANTFLSVIDQYDTGYWSLYSRWPRWVNGSPHYNFEHATQLRVLYLITGHKKFLKYSEKFECYGNNWISRTRYVFANHLRQVKNLSFGDIKRVPEFLKRVLIF